MPDGIRRGWVFPSRIRPRNGGLGWSTSTDERVATVEAALDDVDEAFWRHVTHLGAAMGAGSAAAGMFFAVETSGTNRAAIIFVLSLLLLGSLSVLALPIHRIVGGNHRSLFFGIWAASLPIVTTVLMILDGSIESPFVTLYLLALVFAASAAAPQFVVAVGALSLAGFFLVHQLTDVIQPLAWSLFQTQMVLLVAVTAAWLAGSQHRRARWLRHLSTELGFLAGSHGSLLTAAGEGIYEIDADGRVTFANPMACRLLDRDLDELLGVDAHDVFHHSRRDGTPAPIDECEIVRATTERHRIDITTSVYWTPDGSPLEVDHSVAPLDGGGAVVVFRDVSELRAAQRQKDEFISVVSHELRTPLTSVRGALGLLAGGALGLLESKALDVVQIASSNADRLSRLINDMLDIERLESGKALLRLETCNLRTLMDATLEENRVMADQAGIGLRAVCPASLPVLVDPDRLRQILTNLVSNAVKFSESGQEVLVRGHTREGQVQVDVVDQGRGIPPSHREKIFGRFEQVDASDSRRKGGTGLGLAICDGLVRQHGGRIWVESTLGEGSTFSFTLPQPTSAQTTRGHGPLVLIISGDDEVCETAMSILAADGYQAVSAASAEEGIDNAVKGHPMVILVDAVLSDADGWEVAATLAELDETASTPVIILGTEPPPSPGSAPVQVHGYLNRNLTDRDLLPTVGSALAGPGRLPIVLVVEDDLDLAEVMTTGFSDRGVRAAHAASAEEARAWCERALPNAILLDLNLRDGSGIDVLDWLRDHNQLDQVAVAVYTLLDVDAAELRRIGVGMDRVFVKSRATPAAVQDRVLEIMKQTMEEKVGV